MKKFKWVLLILNLGILLVYFNLSIFKKETIINKGQLVLLELAPKDPRSLMQGDYMVLRYAIAEVGDEKLSGKRGYCVVRLDELGVAQRQRFQETDQPLGDKEFLIRYTATDSWNVFIGAESYFFQEGHAERYENAKYGGLRIDQNGNSVLVGLYDEQKQLIQ